MLVPLPELPFGTISTCFVMVEEGVAVGELSGDLEGDLEGNLVGEAVGRGDELALLIGEILGLAVAFEVFVAAGDAVGLGDVVEVPVGRGEADGVAVEV